MSPKISSPDSTPASTSASKLQSLVTRLEWQKELSRKRVASMLSSVLVYLPFRLSPTISSRAYEPWKHFLGARLMVDPRYSSTGLAALCSFAHYLEVIVLPKQKPEPSGLFLRKTTRKDTVTSQTVSNTSASLCTGVLSRRSPAGCSPGKRPRH